MNGWMDEWMFDLLLDRSRNVYLTALDEELREFGKGMLPASRVSIWTYNAKISYFAWKNKYMCVAAQFHKGCST